MEVFDWRLSFFQRWFLLINSIFIIKSCFLHKLLFVLLNVIFTLTTLTDFPVHKRSCDLRLKKSQLDVVLLFESFEFLPHIFYFLKFDNKFLFFGLKHRNHV